MSYEEPNASKGQSYEVLCNAIVVTVDPSNPPKRNFGYFTRSEKIKNSLNLSMISVSVQLQEVMSKMPSFSSISLTAATYWLAGDMSDSIFAKLMASKVPEIRSNATFV